MFHKNIKINKISNMSMKKQIQLDELFASNKNGSPTSRMNNVNKFIDCLNNTKDKKCKQIRIVQMGSGNSNFPNKPFLTTQPIKKSIPELTNNEVFFPNNLEKNCFFFVEASKKATVQIKSFKLQKNHCRTISPEKNSGGQAEYVVVSSTKSKNWICRKKNIEDLPAHFQRNNSQNEKGLHPNADEHEDDQNFSKSVNLFNKFKIIEEVAILKPDSKQKHEQKRKLYIEPNRKTPQDLAEEERRAKLELKRQICQDYAKPFNPPTNISAAAYIIFEPDFSHKGKLRNKCYPMLEGIEDVRQESRKKYPHSHKVIASFQSRNSVQVASLTKIMTCILALELCQRYNVDAKMQKIEIGKFESNIEGTSAQISEGETYTLEDLYYGLMLPSGNDASVAIAVWGGRTILRNQNPNQLATHKKKQFYNRFIMQMNNKAKSIGLLKTTYANSHGLVNCENRSCAFDLAILCEHAMMNAKFKSIVSCRNYQTKITYFTRCSSPTIVDRKKSVKVLDKDDNDEIEEGEEKELDSNEEEGDRKLEEELVIGQKNVEWENTHRLVQQKPNQYIGIKTGITTAAGPCLSSCVKSRSGRCFIIIVLNCDKLSMRFKDTQNLKKWLYQKEGMLSPRKRADPQLQFKQQQYQQN